MTNNSYSVANGGEVNALRRDCLRQRQLRDGMERSSFLSSGVKFALQVLLRDVEINQGHVDIFVPQQLHEGGQTNTEAQHGGCEGVSQAVGVTEVVQTALRAALAKVLRRIAIQV